MQDTTIRNKVFPMLVWLIVLMTIGAYTVSKALAGVFGVTAQSIAASILLNPIGLIGTLAVYFIFFLLAYFTARIKIVNVITASLFALIMGVGIFGSVFFVADAINAQIIPEALILTSGVFVLAMLFQWFTRKDLSHWSWWLFFLLLVALGLTIAEIFVQASWFRIAVDLGVVLLFILFVMFDTHRIREELPDEDWMLGVINFFLDIANILIRIIALLIEIYAQQ
ncbi:MAG: Bax inhibitor-1/YccA family protein [Candidatus Asgardarchaeia archaeon]|nr:MAG: hypothetical protein DRO67_10095 [Candidatus Asgardarchaeum californiense]